MELNTCMHDNMVSPNKGKKKNKPILTIYYNLSKQHVTLNLHTKKQTFLVIDLNILSTRRKISFSAKKSTVFFCYQGTLNDFIITNLLKN